MIFRIIGDTIELDGLPVATILTSVWPARRGYLVETLETYEPDGERVLEDERDELRARVEELENTIAGLREEIENLQAEIVELEDAQND